MQSRYSVDDAGWNWSSFRGFGTKTWPSDARGNTDSVSNFSNTLDQSVQSASPRDPFSGRIRSFKAWTIRLNNDNEIVVEGMLEWYDAWILLYSKYLFYQSQFIKTAAR